MKLNLTLGRCWNPFQFNLNNLNSRLEDLLKAGINEAEYLIIVNKEKVNSNEEEAVADCNTILAVQYIFRYEFLKYNSDFISLILCLNNLTRMFPKVKICSEIVDSNNMRFMQFRAHDQFALQISKREKV